MYGQIWTLMQSSTEKMTTSGTRKFVDSYLGTFTGISLTRAWTRQPPHHHRQLNRLWGAQPNAQLHLCHELEVAHVHRTVFGSSMMILHDHCFLPIVGAYELLTVVVFAYPHLDAVLVLCLVVVIPLARLVVVLVHLLDDLVLSLVVAGTLPRLVDIVVPNLLVLTAKPQSSVTLTTAILPRLDILLYRPLQSLRALPPISSAFFYWIIRARAYLHLQLPL